MATLYQVIHTLQQISLAQPNIRSTGEGALFEFMNAQPGIKYDVIYFTQGRHQTYSDDPAAGIEGYEVYNLNVFYISRLKADYSNALEIESTGKEIITNIIRTFCDQYESEINGRITWQSFRERFADLCGGIYANVSIRVPIDIICTD